MLEDHENCIFKVKGIPSHVEMRIKLGEIFIHDTSKFIYTKKELLNLEFKTTFIQRLSLHLGLLFIDRGPSENNLCFAFDPNLTPTYKIEFSASDIKRFLDQTLSSEIYHIGLDSVQFPKSLDL